MINPKQVAGEKAAEYIKSGMLVGLGTGSTAYWATKKIGELVRLGLKIHCVPTSESTEEFARELEIPLLDIADVEQLDITIDGADEVDRNKDLIKGGGGALLREKIIASITKYYIIVVDASKRVEILGKFPVPVEVTPFAFQITERQLSQFGCTTKLRSASNAKPYVTDNGNLIIDCSFGKIDRPDLLATNLNQLPGVVENGLFPKQTDLVICADEQGKISIF